MTEYQIKARKLRCTLMMLSLLALVAVVLQAHAADSCDAYRRDVMREAQAVYGPDAPSPMFLAQARQESSCRANVTASDLGRGLVQFMDGTSAQVSRLFPELGAPNPYDPRWSIRAQVRYDGWIARKLAGRDECNRWAAALTGYNGGPGYVLQAQRASKDPGQWFGVTEYVPTRQSPANHEYARTYPRKILFIHQKRYATIGRVVCPHGAV